MKPEGMQTEPPDRVSGSSVFAVAGNGRSFPLKVYPDLIFFTRLEAEFDQRIGRTLSEDTVVGDGYFPSLVIAYVHPAVAVFAQVGFDIPFQRLQAPFRDGYITTVRDQLFPVPLQPLLNSLAPCQHHEPRCFSVESMDNEYFVAGMFAFDQFAYQGVGSPLPFFFGGYRK